MKFSAEGIPRRLGAGKQEFPDTGKFPRRQAARPTLHGLAYAIRQVRP
jgi:hypothetical protein